MKTLIAIFTTIFITGTVLGQCPLAFEEADQSAISIYIAPINGDTPLIDYNSSMLLTPASVMKAVTTASVLSKYSGDYRWTTDVMAVGNVCDSILNGNVIIRGSGDPTIESKHFTGNRASFISSIREGLRARGIKKITGRVLLEDHWPDEGAVPSWELEDIPGIDGAGFYALNYSDNVFSLEFPSLVTTPFIPGLNINIIETNNRLRLNRNPGSYDLTISGKLGKNEKKAALLCSMVNPIEVAQYHLTDSLQAEGNEIECLNDTITITKYKSPRLRYVTRSYMIRSDNQMAEAALRLMSPKSTRRRAIEVQKNLLSSKGANLLNANINDGSGLSRHNTISTSQLGSILRIMASNNDYVNSFARVGKDGTVRNFMKGKPGRECFILKSGSMTGVVAYAGYRVDPESNKPTHVIAVIVNNAPYTTKARNAIADLLSELDFN